jgi:hypothetical protein
MRRLAIFVSLSALFAGGLTLGTVAPAMATNTYCTGFLSNTTIINNLVDPGGYCELQNVTINGNLTGQPGSDLRLDAGVHIKGNLIANNMSFCACRNDVVQIDGYVYVTGGRFQICDNWIVLGNVTLLQLSGSPFSGGDGDPVNVHINGNFTWQNGSSIFGQIVDWVVMGNGFINNNGFGFLDVFGSKFGGYLSCSNNTGSIDGSDNTSGSKLGPNKDGFMGQCAELGGKGGSAP